MNSIILYGRNDAHGYNLHRRAALSFNCLAEVLTDDDDEIVFVDYNTPDELPTFVNDDTQLLAVSNDSIHTLRVFAEQEGLEYPLLSDFWPHGEVSRAYGVFDADKGCAVRGTFIIDKEGVVRWTVVNALPDARDLNEYVAALDTL